MPTTAVRDQVLAWEQMGDGAADVLLVHGWQNAGSTWAPLLDRLDGSRHRMTIVDLPGCGASPAPPSPQGATIDAWAQDLLALMVELGLDRPVLVGHSLGGAIGLAATLSAPEALAGLVLVAPASTSGMDFVTDEQFEVLLRPTPQQREALARAAFHRPLEPSQLQGVLGLVEAADPVHVEAAAWSMRDFDIRDRLAEVAVPTLLIAGDRDRHVPIGHHLDTWRAIPRCGLHVHHDVGHVPFWEVPDDFAAVVSRFLERVVGVG
jgi:sigma-B regulation protein RsbQ